MASGRARSRRDVSERCRVLTVMRGLPGPADRNLIHEQLVDGGRFDSIDDISLTLSGLKRSGRAEKLGQGLWQVADETAAAEVR